MSKLSYKVTFVTFIRICDIIKEDLDDYVDSYPSSLQDSIALEITSEMIDEFLEQDRQNRIRSLKEDIKDYQKSIDRMTKELEELEKIAEM